jgi:hypothetical protein
MVPSLVDGVEAAGMLQPLEPLLDIAEDFSVVLGGMSNALPTPCQGS